jgi:acyl-CoA synthetase (AMP-forming)/AMP-acid ligase II
MAVKVHGGFYGIKYSIPALPKTPTGKISKGPLRDEFGRWTTSRAEATH